MKALSFALPCLLALGPSLGAQAITSGTLVGRVRRASDGSGLPSATLRLRNPTTGWVRVLQAGEGGDFRFSLVPVGDYELTSIAPGLLTRKLRGIRVSLGSVREVRVDMEEAEASAVVEVVGAASEVDVVQTSLVSRFSSEALEALPTESRNLTDILLQTPGAATPAPGLVSVDGARATQNHVMVDGLSATSAYSGFPFGALSSSFLFSLGTVQEVQVLSEAFDVQFGEATGAIVNALTRSGTNEFRGQALLLEHPEALTARMGPVEQDPYGILNTPANLDRHLSSRTLNLVLGGPLVRDRAHFLLGFERLTFQETFVPGLPLRDVDGSRPADLVDWQQALGDRLVVGPGNLPWSQDVRRSYPSDARNDTLFAKVDLRAGADHGLSLRLHSTRWQGQGWGGSYSTSSNTLRQEDGTTSAVFELQSLVGARWVHELRAQVATERYTAQTAPGPFPEIDIGTLAAGPNAYAPQRFSETLLELSDVWMLASARSVLKAGFDLKAVDCRDDYLPFRNGAFEFPDYRTAAGWATGNATSPYEIRYTQSYRLGEDSDRLGESIRSAFLQVQFLNLFGRGLDLQGGLRGTWQGWDAPRFSNPQLGGTDTPGGASSLDPRLSFAWRGGRRWTLRGGVCRFSSPNLGVLGLLARTRNGRVSGLLDYSAPPGDEVFATGFLSPGARLAGDRLLPLDPAFLARYLQETGGQTLNLWDPDGRMAQARKAALELEYELGPRMVLRGRLSLSRTAHLAYWINLNLAQEDEAGRVVPGAFYADGYPTRVNRFSHRGEDRPGFALIRGRRVDFPKAGDVYLSTHGGRAACDALSLELHRRAERGFGFLIQATLSKAEDMNTNEHSIDIGTRSVIADPADPGEAWAPSDYDQRFRFHATLDWVHPSGLRASLTGRYESPLPITARDTQDLNGDGLYNDPSPGWGGRNGRRLRGTRYLDARLTQRLPWLPTRWGAEAVLEVYNLLNWANARTTNFYATSMGTPLPGFAATNLPDRNSRSLRVGLQVTW